MKEEHTLDQNKAPIYEALQTFRQMRVVPFDVPGHKRGRGNPELTRFLGEQCVSIDVNSMKPLDNLCHPISVIREAEELAADEPSVIITRRPCVLLKTVQKHPPYRVEAEACKGCKQCMKIGCPAISWKDKKAVVDPTQCVGCGVCEQLCKFGAFRHEG